MKLSFHLRLLTILFLSALIVSCKKDKDPEPSPDLATRSSGTYKYAQLIYDGKTHPAYETDLKGTVVIKRNTAESVDAELNIRQKSDNAEVMVFSVEGLELEESGGTVSLVYEGETVATLKGNKLTLNSEDESGDAFTLVLEK